MKPLFLISCMVAIILLLALAVPATAAPGISSINPAYAYNGAKVTGIVITGTGFNITSSLGGVRLKRYGYQNISATLTAISATSLTCSFPLAGAESGDWDVVVVNRDKQEDVLSGGFTIKSAIALTSISPTYAQTNNDSVRITLTGSGLSDVQTMYLNNIYYNNITSDITSQTSTKVVGIFDLTDAHIDTYKICVTDSVETIKCGLEFDIVTDEVGSIDIESSPSGAKVYLDSEYIGTSPRTIEDVSPGSHKITISSAGYTDYTKWVTVKAASTVSVSADLNQIESAATTRVPTVATTKTPLKVTTVKVPTSWPTPATTQTSLDATLVPGAIALGVMVLHRKS